MAKGTITVRVHMAWWLWLLIRALAFPLRPLVRWGVLSADRAGDVLVAVGIFLARWGVRVS